LGGDMFCLPPSFFYIYIYFFIYRKKSRQLTYKKVMGGESYQHPQSSISFLVKLREHKVAAIGPLIFRSVAYIRNNANRIAPI
jgi:hypothetical protein